VAQPTTSTVGRERLIDSLDTLADVAHAIEQAVDRGVPLDDRDDLIGRIRGVIADLAFELEASDFLSGAGHPHQPPPGTPGQHILDLGEALRQLDVEHHQARERILAELARQGAAAPPACLHCATPLTVTPDGHWQHPDTGCYYSDQPHVADRRTDAPITVRVDPDGHPLVWADNGDVVIGLGDPGAGVAGVRATVVVAGRTADGGSPTWSANSTTRCTLWRNKAITEVEGVLRPRTRALVGR
jgi:hypothetical protein